jgi:hypothetical protein
MCDFLKGQANEFNDSLKPLEETRLKAKTEPFFLGISGEPRSP